MAAFEIENGVVKHKYSISDRGALVGSYCVVKRKGASMPVFNYVELKEYTTNKSLWITKPATMIKKVAEAQCLRMAFQSMFSGTYDESEQWEIETKPVVKVAETKKQEIKETPDDWASKKTRDDFLSAFGQLAILLKWDDATAGNNMNAVLKNRDLKDLTETELKKIVELLNKKLNGANKENIK